jgi:hypothetical protein
MPAERLHLNGNHPRAAMVPGLIAPSDLDDVVYPIGL